MRRRRARSLSDSENWQDVRDNLGPSTRLREKLKAPFQPKMRNSKRLIEKPDRELNCELEFWKLPP